MEKSNVASSVKWSSRIEFVVALLGYSIGMPEFWRVPYLTFRNGGGSFIIAYILLMLVCGLPLYFVELALSQYSGKGPWRFWDICPLLRGVSIAVAVINGLSGINAAILEVWAFEYFVNSFKSVLPWTNCDNDWNTPSCLRDGSQTSSDVVSMYHNVSNYNRNTYNFIDKSWTTERKINNSLHYPVDSVNEFWLYRILRISDGFDHIGSISLVFVAYLFVMRLIAAFSMVKSVKSIGKIMYVTALLPIILVLMIWIRALTLPGATKGMLYFISTDITRLADSQLWTEAAFQAFMTLGPGWGGLMMIGAHSKFKTNCFSASVISTSATLTFGLVNGLVVFSVLGVMSEEAGVPIKDMMTSGGFSIGFIAYPKALSYFPLPQLWCVIFYLVILLPGLDVMVVDTEPFLMVLEEMFPKTLSHRRIPLLTIVSVVMFVLSLPLATQGGVYFFLLVNWYTGTWSVTLICLAECVIFAWIYGAHRIDRDVRLMIGRPLPVIVRFSTAFIMPVFLTCLLFISIFTYKPPSFGDYEYPLYARAIGWCFILMAILPILMFCVWIISKEEGSLHNRLQHLLRHTAQWSPASEKVEDVHRATELMANFTWKQLFWFNLTGKGGIIIDKRKEDVPML
ncbi:sodium- and chloride-dependent glycine transporter 2-like [Ylistrum balloti]|uniref:sodium- and chloride-dependent glycine transporter 2-like n=1 Tax=Ylistrum balloti TaxID=509963 RepID=UPI0029058CDE|nr:sodium- and chloride-dependent glycine transporter 2-like [Ylistrum balloti]